MATYTALSNQEAASGWTNKITITHADLTDGDTAQDITLAVLNEGEFIEAAGYALKTDFASANGTGLTMSVGNSSSATAYAAAKELQGSEVDYWRATTATPPTGAADQVGETETVFARFTTSGGSSPLLSEYTAGEVDVFIRVSKLSNRG